MLSDSGLTITERLESAMDSLKPVDKPSHMAKFPYVNGELLREQYWIRKFNARMRPIFLDCARMNWAHLNPDIFGSMFQAVIKLLFLQCLRVECEQLISLSNENAHKNQKINF